MLELNSGEFTVRNPRRSQNSYSRVFNFKSENKKTGNLVMTLDLDIEPNQGNKISEILGEILKREYFKAAKNNGPENIAKNFEQALGKVNETLSMLAKEGYVDWIGKLGAGILATQGKQMHLTSCGKVKAFLIRGDQLIDISKNVSHNDQKSPLKTFSNVVSGDLQADDRLLISSGELTDLLSREKIRRTVKQNSPQKAASHFEAILDSTEELDSLAGVILSVEKEKKKSLDNLNLSALMTETDELADSLAKNDQDSRTEKKDEAKLNNENKETKPSQDSVVKAKISEDFKTSMGRSEKTIKETTASEKNSMADDLMASGPPLPSSILPTTKKLEGLTGLGGSESAGQKTASPKENKLKRILAGAKSKVKSFNLGKKRISKPKFLTKKSSPQSKRQDRLDRLNKKSVWTKFSGLTRPIKRLPKTSKIFLGASLGVAVVFGAAVFIFSDKKEDDKIEAITEISLDEAVQKEQEAADSLIYGDTNQAKMLLAEAEALIASASAQGEVDETVLGELRTRIAADYEQINGVTRIDEPLIAASFNGEGKLGEQIFDNDGQLLAYNSESNLIYDVLGEGGFAPIFDDSENVGHFILGAINLRKGTMIFYTDTPAMIEIDLDSGVIYDRDFEFAAAETGIVDLGVYNDRVYALDPSAKQIYKHTRTIAGFSKGEEWITERVVDLSNLVSMTIDGSIYVLRGDGAIFNFLSGDQRDYNMTEVPGGLSAASDIYTNVFLENIYILDPEKKRVVVMDKNGEYINQYTCEKFSELKDVVVPEGEEKMYILNSDKVYEVDLKEGEI